MHQNQPRLRHGALAASAAALALLTAGCAKASTGVQSDGCRDEGHWPAREQAAWLRPAVSFRTAGDRVAVVISAHRSGDARPLCRPALVQVQFWTLTAAGTGMSSVMRYRLSTDGGRTRTVGFPAGLLTGGYGACTAALVAAYAGPPLSEDELPRKAPDMTSSTGTRVRFGTRRIAAYRLLPPDDPARCGTHRPAASPSPGASTTWDVHHP